MNLAKLAIGRERYYLDTVAAGREDHRGPGLEPDGVWLGRAAAQLELAGTVSAKALTEVLAGIHPGTGEALNPAQARVRVAGFDLTFAAPKSISVLFGLVDDELGAQIRRSHEVAVADAVSYLEREAVSVRRRGDGRRWSSSTTGLVAAGFTHRTSRSLDPHLHTHVLAANMAMGQDGRWSALDARGLYAHARTAGFLYQGRLRHELVDRLGLELGPVRAGVANLAGMDRTVTAHFSQRRRQVESELAVWLADRPGAAATPRAADVVTLATRPAKDQSRSFDSLRGEWRARARHLGLSPDAAASLVGRSRSVPMPEIEAMAAALTGPDGTATRAGELGRRDLLRAVVECLPQGAEVRAVESRVAELVAWAGLVERTASPAPPPDRWRSRDGRPMVSGVAEARWTTPALAAQEATLVERARRRSAEGTGLVGDGDLVAALAARHLGSPERAQVQRLVGAGAGIEVLLARPGIFRGDVLDAAREAWQASGWRVEGVALTSGAARGLEAATGIQGQSLDAYLDGPGTGLGSRTVVVVVGAEGLTLDQLGSLVGRAGRHKVVLVGDPSRRGPAEGVLARISEDLAGVGHARGLAPDLAGDRGSGDPDQPRPGGRGQPSVTVPLGPTGTVVLASTGPGARRALLEDWWAADARGERPTMVVPGPGEAALLNREARDRLRAGGRLGAILPGTTTTLHPTVRSDLAVGDRVMLRWGRPGWDLAAGAEATVVGLGPDGRDLRLRSGDQETGDRETSLPLAQIRPGQLVYAYALSPADARRRRPEQALVLGGPELVGWAGSGPVGAPPGGRCSYYLVDTGDLRPSAARLVGVPDRLLELAPHGARSGLASSGAASGPRPSLVELGQERERLRRDLLRSLPPDPGPALAAVAEEEVVVARGLARARMAQGRAAATPLEPARAARAREPAGPAPETGCPGSDFDGRRPHGRSRRSEGRSSRPLARLGPWRSGRPEAVGPPPSATPDRGAAQAGAAAMVQRWELAARRLEVRQAEVEAMVQSRADWVRSRERDLDRYRALTEAVQLRSRALVRAAEIAPGGHLLEALGPRPEPLDQRGAWQEGVAAIESWREQWGVTDPALALGRRGHHDPEGRADPSRRPEPPPAWPGHAVEAVVERTRHQLGRGKGVERAVELAQQR